MYNVDVHHCYCKFISICKNGTQTHSTQLMSPLWKIKHIFYCPSIFGYKQRMLRKSVLIGAWVSYEQSFNGAFQCYIRGGPALYVIFSLPAFPGQGQRFSTLSPAAYCIFSPFAFVATSKQQSCLVTWQRSHQPAKAPVPAERASFNHLANFQQ